jgi:hypothetical protein
MRNHYDVKYHKAGIIRPTEDAVYKCCTETGFLYSAEPLFVKSYDPTSRRNFLLFTNT